MLLYVVVFYLMYVMFIIVFAGSEFILKSLNLSEQHGRETTGGRGQAGWHSFIVSYPEPFPFPFMSIYHTSNHFSSFLATILLGRWVSWWNLPMEASDSGDYLRTDKPEKIKEQATELHRWGRLGKDPCKLVNTCSKIQERISSCFSHPRFSRLKMHIHGAGPHTFANIGHKMVSFPSPFSCTFPFIELLIV